VTFFGYSFHIFDLGYGDRELTDAEITALVTAVTDEEVWLVVIALLTGVSVQELVMLRWDEIDLDAGAIHLRSRVLSLAKKLVRSD
jgi:integrase